MAGYVFDQLGRLIDKGLSHGQGDETTRADMLRDIQSRRLQLWAVENDQDVQAAIVVRVKNYVTGPKVFVELLVGTNSDDWADMVEQTLLKLKRLVGATCIEASCRVGLAAALAARGWSRKATIMELK